MDSLRIAFGMVLSCVIAACTVDQQRAAPRDISHMSAEEILGAVSRVVDCEWKAVGRYDDGQSTIAELAQRIMGICAVERVKAKVAMGLSPNDPQLEANDFKHAVEIAESARKAKSKKL